jgi:transcriptional regulator with GAF, ATPase, and Fis domain
MGRKMGKNLTEIEPDTLRALQAHPWPGNIRDLQNTIERAAVLARGNAIRVDWILSYPGTGQPSGPFAKVDSSPSASGAGGTAPGESQSLEAVERNHIIAVLKRTRGVIEGPQGAAKLLKMNASTTRFRMRKLGITRADFAPDTEL